ncbi:hypothetical protein ACIHJG_07940 [Streptomyces sp. NPDC052415]
MSEQTPSQAEGDRQPDTADDERTDTPRTTPSQAEGEAPEDTDDTGTSEQ